jgi:two-component system OmpR family response regulator
MVGGVNVLVVEDEVKMAALIRRGLSEQGLTVDVAGAGEEAVGMARASGYDAIVLDVILPGIDGFETCRQMRQEGIWSPVLMLTARGALEDRVAGLDGGADDYLTKPFSFAELLARLRALVRRGQSERPAIVEVGDLRLDPATHQVWRGETEIELSSKEFVLLEAFMRRPGHVLTRSQLLDQAWEYDFEHRSNVIEVYIRSLRRKIDLPFEVKSLETVRGAGSDCERTAAAESRLDPPAGDPRLRRRDGAGPRRYRRLRLPALLQRARCHDQRRPALAGKRRCRPGQGG